MADDQPNNPLHGITLKALLEEIQRRHGWAGLAARVDINCFKSDPSLSSSLKFLRKTPWARAKVEQVYLDDLALVARLAARDARRAAREAARASSEASEGPGED